MTNPASLAPYPGVPTLLHPGPIPADRIVCVPTRLTAHDTELPAGTPLLMALEQLLDKTGGRAAVGELYGGELAEFSYYIPAVGGEGGPAATFSAPKTAACPGRLLRGGLTIGHKNGAVFAHSHALFTGSDGRQRAGHLIPETVVLGERVQARVWAAADVAIEVQPDPETTMSLFVPRRDGETPHSGIDAVICRIRPNIDLVSAIEALTDDRGWARADVRGQIGSLVGGRLGRPDGSVAEADGPATEVMFLDGSVRRAGGVMRADLTAHLVDRHGVVHSGRLLPKQNPVAMTFELVLGKGEDDR